MVTLGIEFTDFKCEVRCDFGGRLEAVVDSRAIKMDVRSSMHMETRVNYL